MADERLSLFCSISFFCRKFRGVKGSMQERGLPNGYANKDISAIAVGWDYTEPDGLHSFIIYRSADGWPYQTYEAYLVFDGRPNPALLTDDQHMEQASAGLMLPYVFIDKGVE